MKNQQNSQIKAKFFDENCGYEELKTTIKENRSIFVDYRLKKAIKQTVRLSLFGLVGRSEDIIGHGNRS